MLQNTVSKPEYPPDQWKNLLLGDAVDLDKVLSAINSRSIDNKFKQSIGDKMVIEFVGETKATKKVKTHTDWISAFSKTKSAILFLFGHRREELDKYSDYIKNMFRSISPKSHRAVIHADQAIREQVA
ncbi:hypothetical protein SCHPADRAFT_947726 [Schizopora paradoxa]|uniref:Uncharacterized protein n=1 Tax=Schizopora paradoxa TaxID=27342 RepID=A0A0H2R4J0_9AGAM|nr:hypothetical protein SCHPADRAFT_947726 [Schizopora paradoxa]